MTNKKRGGLQEWEENRREGIKTKY